MVRFYDNAIFYTYSKHEMFTLLLVDMCTRDAHALAWAAGNVCIEAFFVLKHTVLVIH